MRETITVSEEEDNLSEEDFENVLKKLRKKAPENIVLQPLC